MTKKTTTYKQAGVDIDAGIKTVDMIRAHVESTASKNVLAGIGSFGGLFDLTDILKNYREPVLVQSIDGVGTKLMVAAMAGDHTSIGEDIVNHCCNDVLCQGARPLTFLDYVAMSRLEPEQVEQIVCGMAKACREADLSILGGETAELPGMYRENQCDVAGIVTGVVEKSELVTGQKIFEGDVLVGLASDGLHTNGYTLARKVLFEYAGLKLDDMPESLNETVGEAMLKPHKNYAPLVLEFLKKEEVRGMAHITGGGLIGNLSRIMPTNLQVCPCIKRECWPVPTIFNLIRQLGNVPPDDMERTFNMGIGFILVMPPSTAKTAVDFFTSNGQPAYEIGIINSI
ncbi:MAG: phosphoribosylformylglycinamidine cyclo-ligase [bacterium]|nr:MAG: phosphoribosylformylglycinamidine cyclo-ligase [bacterium]